MIESFKQNQDIEMLYANKTKAKPQSSLEIKEALI